MTLIPMGDAAYTAWRQRLIIEYARENVASGRWTADEAEKRSRQSIEEALPQGLSTVGQHVWTVVDEAGSNVGVLWLSTSTGKPGHAFIYDIEITEDRRGEGLGRAALEALEAWARANAITSIGLHVFGNNAVARRLYARMGYIETNVQMEKRLLSTG